MCVRSRALPVGNSLAARSAKATQSRYCESPCQRHHGWTCFNPSGTRSNARSARSVKTFRFMKPRRWSSTGTNGAMRSLFSASSRSLICSRYQAHPFSATTAPPQFSVQSNRLHSGLFHLSVQSRARTSADGPLKIPIQVVLWMTRTVRSECSNAAIRMAWRRSSVSAWEVR